LDLAQIVARHTQRKDARSIQELVDAGLWVVDDSGWIGLADDSRTKILMPDTARTSVSRHLEHLLERDEWTCGICQNVLETGTEMHVDHIIPRSRGGDDCLSNLQPAHARCNIWKGSRLESELDLAEMGA
jgi:hypothetical protein